MPESTEISQDVPGARKAAPLEGGADIPGEPDAVVAARCENSPGRPGGRGRRRFDLLSAWRPVNKVNDTVSFS